MCVNPEKGVSPRVGMKARSIDGVVRSHGGGSTPVTNYRRSACPCALSFCRSSSLRPREAPRHEPGPRMVAIFNLARDGGVFPSACSTPPPPPPPPAPRGPGGLLKTPPAAGFFSFGWAPPPPPPPPRRPRFACSQRLGWPRRRRGDPTSKPFQTLDLFLEASTPLLLPIPVLLPSAAGG
jgi:hypothetical protein